MPTPSAANAKDRRRSPRAQCRLHGRITRGRESIRVRIVDVSEGGLCLLSPVWFDPKKPVQIAIDVPGRGVATVRVEVWHIRREKSRISTNKVWTAGAILVDSDGAYAQLLEAAGLAGRVEAPSTTHSDEENPEASKPEPRSAARDLAVDSVDPRIFRLRCKAKGSPRTRLLTITAESEPDALALARKDLGAEWDVLEALEA
jgi:PilZ domain